MTVRELLARIDSRELTEWMAYYEVEPWGSEIDDHRFGTVASTIANVNRDPKKRSQPYKPNDFFPRRDEAWDQDIEQNGMMWREFIAPFKKRGGA